MNNMNNNSVPFHQRAKSTPGQLSSNSDNPFDDDFGDEDPFAEDNPNNPFNDPFGTHSNNNNNNNNNANPFFGPSSQQNDNNRRTDATQQTF